MGIPAWDNITNPPDPIRKGVQVHLVTDTNEHQRAAISEVVSHSPTDECIIQVDGADPARYTGGRYTTPAHHDEQHAVGTWHFIEQ